MSITEINLNSTEGLSKFSENTINNEKKYKFFPFFLINHIYINIILKNIILIFYIALCPILTIFSIIWYLFNIIKSIYKYLFLNCNNFEKDLENQYIYNKL